MLGDAHSPGLALGQALGIEAAGCDGRPQLNRQVGYFSVLNCSDLYSRYSSRP